jgi:hypothetical protein
MTDQAPGSASSASLQRSNNGGRTEVANTFMGLLEDGLSEMCQEVSGLIGVHEGQSCPCVIVLAVEGALVGDA